MTVVWCRAVTTAPSVMCTMKWISFLSCDTVRTRRSSHRQHPVRSCHVLDTNKCYYLRRSIKNHVHKINPEEKKLINFTRYCNCVNIELYDKYFMKNNNITRVKMKTKLRRISQIRQDSGYSSSLPWCCRRRPASPVCF